jgi:predicted enzyme related to lactoylglutathione lyase
MQLSLTLDSTDPERVAAFWAAGLGYTNIGEFGGYWPLAPADEGETPLVIHRVSEPRVGKNRMHLDIHVPDAHAEALRLEALGATRLRSDVIVEHGYRWWVMADPGGNEFCVTQVPG